MKFLLKCMPWLFLALLATEIIAILLPKHDGEFHVREFGRLPVLLGGRIQPFDSVARNSLLQIRSTADVPLEEIPAWKFWHHPEKLKSTAWLLEVMCRTEQADERPIFLIHHPDLLGELKLGDTGVEKSGLRYYTFNQLKPLLPEIMEQAGKASSIDEKLHTPFQKQILKLANAVVLYRRLALTLHSPDSADFAGELDQIQKAIEPGIVAITAKEAGKPYDQAANDKLVAVLDEFYPLQQDRSAGQVYPLVVPPAHPDVARDEWGNIGTGVLESIRSREIYAPLRWLATASVAYHNQNAAVFNQSVAEYAQWLKSNLPAEWAKGRHEFFYNDLHAFLHAMIIYIFAFIIGCCALLTFGEFPQLSESLRLSALYLIALAGLVHTVALVFRMVLEGRPPVTNLYSSAIFIGWGAMVLGIGLERIYKIGIGNVVAALAGFVTLLIAHNLALGGDTMEMLRAVLDTNFWLATHVVIVTLGYASTFVAGLLAIIYVLLGLFTPILSQKLTAGDSPSRKDKTEVGKALAKMVYAIVCFATLFSFVGTVLGGIWADQSWGRFWGWDPKENGALLIVIWNAAILHARWGGMVRERGLMNMAIFGNIVTSFSWFGVNMLGIGLHSYGFMDAAFQWLRLFVCSQIVLIVLGSLPKHLWRSFRQSGTSLPTDAGDSAKRPAEAIR
ncbi:MAG: cytochrome c assembly protein [Pedosphaera sp.]|nr:cytochrome c assembly protein [Pedosphaera sp.]